MTRSLPEHEPPCHVCGQTAGHRVPEGLDLCFVHFVQHEVRVGRRPASEKEAA